MFDCDPITTKALNSPPSSPSKDPRRKNSSDHVPVTPDTADTDGRTRAPKQIPPAGPSPARLSGNKRPAPARNNSFEDQPPAQKLRTDLSFSLSSVSNSDLEDGDKPVSAADGGSSSPPLDVWTLNMEHMLEGLKRVGGTMNGDASSRFKFMSTDPVLACLVSMQTGMMAMTADLMFRRATDEENKGHLIELMRQMEAKLKPNHQPNNKMENNDYLRVKEELEAEKKKKSELKFQISELREKLEDPNQLKQLFKQTWAYKELKKEMFYMGYRSCYEEVAKHMPRADLTFLQRSKEEKGAADSALV